MAKEIAVTQGVAKLIEWWLNERKSKLKKLSHDTMSVNPFLMPLLMKFHSCKDFDELGNLLIVQHLMTGHFTGFGKLVDEKILPNVFNTTKLNKPFRRTNPPFDQSQYDEIDHLVPDGDSYSLLSLKSGKWTIQLTMAVQLNRAFYDIVSDRERREISFSKIVLGAFYGNEAGLTDKYDIARGINRGANHDVIDLTHVVDLYCGKQLWSWVNGGEDQTQNWVMDGILNGYDLFAKSNESELLELMAQYRNNFTDQFNDLIKDGSVDWHHLLSQINS